MTSSLIVKNLVLSIFAQLPFNANSSERERLQKGCKENLKAIGKAIATYRADHDGNMPDWLSDLYPKYLSDPELLLCPVDKERGNPIYKALTDPKMPCSYLYEFSPIKYSFTTWDFDHYPQKEYTYKELRTKQLRYFGNIIPVVRCWHHKRTLMNKLSLDLCYGGKVYILPEDWERSAEAVEAIFLFFQRAIEENSDSWERAFSFQKIATYFRTCNRLPEFQSLLEKASNLSPDALRTLVEIYKFEGKSDQAIERCEQLIQQIPDEIEMRVNLAELYAASENYDAARTEIEQVLRQEPQNSQAYRLPYLSDKIESKS